MTLILTKAPYQPHEGMDDSARVIIPGGRPPRISPHCRQCGVPVESFTLDPLATEYRMSIQATCHGKTSGTWLSHEEAIGALVRGAVIWMDF